MKATSEERTCEDRILGVIKVVKKAWKFLPGQVTEFDVLRVSIGIEMEG